MKIFITSLPERRMLSCCSEMTPCIFQCCVPIAASHVHSAEFPLELGSSVACLGSFQVP